MNQAILQTTPELKFAICEDSPAHLSHNHQILRRNLGDAQPVFSLYISGKELLDILIKMKYPKIISRNISITVSGNFHGISYMEPMDICIIFSNALDNAIECEKKIPETEKRMIHVSMFVQQTFLIIRFENYCEGELNFEQNLPVTTKKQAEFHGYGLKSLRHTVHKYGGEVDIDVEDQWFRLKILIPL